MTTPRILERVIVCVREKAFSYERIHVLEVMFGLRAHSLCVCVSARCLEGRDVLQVLDKDEVV